FLAAARGRHDAAFGPFVTRHFDSVLELVAPRRLPALWRSGALETLWPVLQRAFASPQLRQAFGFQTMYLGLSPQEAPAVFSLLPYTEAEHGIWFPHGGLHGVSLALERVAREEGARLHYSRPVRRVVAERGAVRGVELEDGTFRPARAVICNADYAWASRHLLPPALAARRSRATDRRRFTSSALMFYWGVARRVEGLLHHNVFFGDDFEGSFSDIFERGRVPADPSFYVNAPARTAAGFAPQGHDALYVLVPAPAPGRPVDWAREVPRVRAQVLERLKHEGL